MFKTNESLEAICSIAKKSKFNLRWLADGIATSNEGSVKQLAMRYIGSVLNEAKKSFYLTPHVIGAPELPAMTETYVFTRHRVQGIQVTARDTQDTFTTIDSIAAVGSPRLLTVVEARIGNRDSYVAEYFHRIQKKIQAMMELSPQGFGWVLLLSEDQARRPVSSPFLEEFKRMNGRVVVLPYSTAAFRGAVAYHKTG